MEIRESFWEARRNPTIYFAVAYGFGLSVNLASSAVPAGSRSSWILMLGVPLLILAVIWSPYFTRLFQRSGQIVIGRDYPAPQRAGLVVLVSRGEGVATARSAMKHHEPRLRRVWMVHSETSRKDAAELKAEVVGSGKLGDEQVQLVPLTDLEFSDPESVRRCIETDVYANLPDGLGAADIVINITGGRKQTTVGAFLAGLPLERHLEIVNPAVTNERGVGLEPQPAPTAIDIAYKLKRAF